MLQPTKYKPKFPKNYKESLQDTAEPNYQALITI